jgi:GT2 family glycosyltransferase
LISVLLPARDSAPTLGAAVASVLRQTVYDFELLVIDDGSRDDTRAVLARFDDRRLRIIDGGGRGLVHALNLGLAEAKGSFIARMDADDESLPRRFERSLQALEDQTLSGVGTAVEIFRDDRPVSPNLLAYGRWLGGLHTPALLFRDRLVESPLCHGSAMLRREVLESAGGWRDGDFPEDWELWLRLLQKGHRLSCVGEVLYRWRDHDRRLTRTDARYRLDRHLRLKARFLKELGSRAAIAGAGKTGLQLSRHLRAGGVHIEYFVDVSPKKIGTRLEGVEVRAPQALGGPDGVHLIAAAGSKGARHEIRSHLSARGWVEGEHFTCAARPLRWSTRPRGSSCGSFARQISTRTRR